MNQNEKPRDPVERIKRSLTKNYCGVTTGVTVRYEDPRPQRWTEDKKGGKTMGEERNDGVLYAGINMEAEERMKMREQESIEKDAELARATYERMLLYAIAGCRRLLWETAFDLNKPALKATQAQDIVYNLGQMANDLDSYEAEAKRMGLGK